jgi:hypothetical protein
LQENISITSVLVAKACTTTIRYLLLINHAESKKESGGKIGRKTYRACDWRKKSGTSADWVEDTISEVFSSFVQHKPWLSRDHIKIYLDAMKTKQLHL